MVDYSIAAIPTEYRGRTYRSRLEARWAAFFDRLGLAHEYEPFDLGAWSPDFLLPDINTLVEIKPLTEFDADTWAKMVDVCQERGLLSGDQQINGLFLSMVAPRLHQTKSGHIFVDIGWVAMPWFDPSVEPRRAQLSWTPHGQEPRFDADIIGVVPGGLCSTSGWQWQVGEAHSLNQPISYYRHGMELWARATSDVQWQGTSEA